MRSERPGATGSDALEQCVRAHENEESTPAENQPGTGPDEQVTPAEEEDAGGGGHREEEEEQLVEPRAAACLAGLVGAVVEGEGDHEDP